MNSFYGSDPIKQKLHPGVIRLNIGGNQMSEKNKAILLKGTRLLPKEIMRVSYRYAPMTPNGHL